MRNGPVIRIGPGEEFPENTPYQYIQGWVEFYKLKFKVTPDVLIPRPETELLVDYVIASAAKQSLTILDLGTGSGCISISIAKNAPKARLFAADISTAALNIARENAKKNHVENRIFFVNSDLLEKFATAPDIIVTNLPYIPSSRISFLDPSVRDFEPLIALDGGPDGFDLYRKLFAQMIEKNLIPKLFVGEIDESQEKIALNEAKKYFPKAKVEVKKDLAHLPRILIIKF